MGQAPLPPSTVGAEEYAERFTNVTSAAFAGDTLNRAVVLFVDDLPNDAQISIKRRANHFLPNIKTQAANGTILVEAGGFAAVAALVPPGVTSPPGDPRTLSPPSIEYKEKFAKVEEKYLQGRPHWYLWIVARNPEKETPGAIRAVIEPYLQKAQDAGLPVWLEATNEHARDVYAHFGFKIVEDVVIGEGSIDRNGNRVEGGEGVFVYGMLKEPFI